ncbi:hypothetical protein AXG93_606s1020 [Marchantia polymorpha subsp. ruderalis]|uniref:Uncharacterized protein n=1 Tax=Marchantia polymorpha subsp. ruderalis TaxID=1480154 RepID=A0A176VJ85_MARPO|nr:hypothetical protein AXG93_606s1020 [Marchantia polymorpha subsp. ruderalis]
MVHCSTRACAEGCDGGPGQSGIVSRVIVGKQQAATTLSVGKKFMSQWAGNETVYTFQGDKSRVDEDWRAAEASSETVNLHSGSEVLATPARVAILSTGDLVLRDILATEEGWSSARTLVSLLEDSGSLEAQSKLEAQVVWILGLSQFRLQA